MKKYIFIPLLFLLGLVSCSESDESTLEETNNTEESKSTPNPDLDGVIKGVINGAEGKVLKFYYVDTDKMLPSGEIKLDANGAFEFQFKKANLNLVQFVLEKESIALGFDNSEAVPFLTATYPNADQNFNVNNSKSVANLVAYNNSVYVHKMYLRNESKQLQVLTQEDSLKRISVIDSLMARKSLIEKKTVEFIAKDYGSPINQILVSDIYPMNGFQNWDRSNLEIIENIHSAYQDKYPQAMFTKRLELDIKSWKNQLIAFDKFQERVKLYGDFSQKIAIGEKAPDIIMDDVNGKELKLSTLKGQVVLLDFWASWCGPCRKANPQLVALYHTYKDKGFTVYSVSLDNDPIAWKQAIQQDGLAWPNHVSDLMGWKTPMTQLYKFSGIPFTVLIDEKGIIAGINVHPQELEQQLQSMLK